MPRLRETGTDWGGGKNTGGDEDLASAAKPVVERIDDESATVDKVSLVDAEYRVAILT